MVRVSQKQNLKLNPNPQIEIVEIILNSLRAPQKDETRLN